MFDFTIIVTPFLAAVEETSAEEKTTIALLLLLCEVNALYGVYVGIRCFGRFGLSFCGRRSGVRLLLGGPCRRLIVCLRSSSEGSGTGGIRSAFGAGCRVAARGKQSVCGSQTIFLESVQDNSSFLFWSSTIKSSYYCIPSHTRRSLFFCKKYWREDTTVQSNHPTEHNVAH